MLIFLSILDVKKIIENIIDFNETDEKYDTVS